MLIKTAAALDFQLLTLEDAAWAVPLLEASGRMGCEYSYTTMFMWRNFYHNRLARLGDHLFFSAGKESQVFLPPMGPSLREGLDILMDYTAAKGEPLKLVGADPAIVKEVETHFPGRFSVTPQQGDFDYLYNQQDLAELPGRKFHSKKNHVSAFSRKFDWSYEPISDVNVTEVVEMAEKWCRLKGNCKDKGLRSENCAIKETLAHRETLSIRGGLIRVDGQVAAFTFGSPINREVFDIHVEKALPDYPGAYAAINQAFAKSLGDFRLLNRENDLDIEGLRKAKISYHPALILEKYICVQQK